MCTAVLCQICGKTTWAGCGDHIEEALEGIPEGERCYGHDGQQDSRQAAALAAAGEADRTISLRGKLSRIFAGK